MHSLQLYNQCVSNARTEVAEQLALVQPALPMSKELHVQFASHNHPA
jgi:hypothetical protein